MAMQITRNLSLQLINHLPIGVLAPIACSNVQPVRYARTKHYTPKWKRLRALKFIKVDLPNFQEKESDISEEEMRSRMKEKGIIPPRPWMERPFFISSTGGIFEEYVPPEGDGKVSSVTAQGAKQKLQFLEKKTKTMLAIRKIRTFEEDFDTPQFCKQAEQIYIKSQEYLMKEDKDDITDYVTEKAYPEIIHNIKHKTIHWKFLKNIELPRVVHARCVDVISKENIFAQLTVRFHSQQILAVYDRFGRLIHGSEIIAKDVLEYVVFEKHLANEYGVWRVHAKIIPNWLPPPEPSRLTFKKPKEEPIVPDRAIIESETEKTPTSTSETIPSPA